MPQQKQGRASHLPKDDLFENVKQAVFRNPHLWHQLVGLDTETLETGKGTPCPICEDGTDRLYRATSFEHDGAVCCRHEGNKVYDAIDAVLAVGLASTPCEAAKRILEHYGEVKPQSSPKPKPERKPETPFTSTQWIAHAEANREAIQTWCNKHKPGTGVVAVLACGGRTGVYQGKPALAFPMFAADLKTVTGMTAYRLDGSDIGGPKIKQMKGSQSGIIGTLNALRNIDLADTVIHVEGVSDLLTVVQSLPKEKRSTTAVFTNASGASENPNKPPFKELLSEISKADCKFLFIGDNDEPGQAGLQTWSRFAQTQGCNASIWTPPTTVFDADVKDVRDFLLSGGTVEDIFKDAEALPQTQTKPAKPKSKPAWDKTPENHGKEKRRVPKIIHLENLKPEPVQWFWENKIPQGAITLLAGREGIGKTFWSTYLAARVSLGGTWADGTPVPKGSVVFFPGEDNPSSSLLPRILAQGADISKIKIFREISVLQGEEEVDVLDVTIKSVDEIRDAIAEVKQYTAEPVRLVVIDPISNFWGGAKENDNSEVRNVLRPISRLAEETGAAFLLITHFSKGQKDDFSDRIIGSVALRTTARAVHHIYKDHERNGYRYIVPVKGNDWIDPTGVEFLINKQAGGQVEIVDASVERDAYDFEAAERHATEHAQGRGRKPVQRHEAEEWLKEFLSDGRKPAGDKNDPLEGTVRYEAEQSGLSWRTVENAKRELGIIAKRDQNVWFWELPQEDQTQDRKNSSSCTTGNSCGLGSYDLRGENDVLGKAARNTDIQDSSCGLEKSLNLDAPQETLDGPHSPPTKEAVYRFETREGERIR